MAAAGGFDIAQFEQIILALMSPDNNMRNQAEEALRQAKQSPETLLPAYVQLLRTNQDPQVRSMCAVLLRKAVMQGGTTESGEATSSLARLSAQAKQVVKSELLACIEAETERSIRKKVCDAVGQFGVSELSANIASWPELHVGETPCAPRARGQRALGLPGPSEGLEPAYAPQSAAPAAWRRGVP